MTPEKKESEKKMLAINLDRIQYVAPIPKGILKEVKRDRATPPKEHPLNGSVYAADAYMPDYWDERIMPSEYNPEMISKR